MRPTPPLKNTASSGQLDGGRIKARRALNSKEIVSQIPQNYNSINLVDILPVESLTWTNEDINRVKNAVIGYCLAMTSGDTSTMAMAAGMLQGIAVNTTHDVYTHSAHSDYGAVIP